MPTPSQTLIDLEKKFWQSLVKQEPAVAMEMLNEPSLMVSSHGTLKFDRAGYRKMAEQGKMFLSSYELSDIDVVFPNDAMAILTYRVKQDMATRDSDEHTVQEMNDTSTWIRSGGKWLCAMHTETPANSTKAPH